MNNENNKHIAIIPIGTQSTDNTQLPGIHFPQRSKIVSVKLINGADVTADDTNFFQLSLKHVGGATVAELDTRAAHENGLVKNTAKGLNVVSAEAEVAAGSNLEIDYQEGGTGTTTLAVLQVEYFPY